MPKKSRRAGRSGALIGPDSPVEPPRPAAGTATPGARQGNVIAAHDIALAEVTDTVPPGNSRRGCIVATGKVKWFNPTKGYGFIAPTGGGQDVFVHISAVEKAGLSTLQENQTVEFEVVSNRGKSSAENLKIK